MLLLDSGIPAHGFEVAVPGDWAGAALRLVTDGVADARAAGVAYPTSPIGVRFVASGEQLLAMNARRHGVPGAPGEVREASWWCFIEVPRLEGVREPEAIPAAVVARLRAAGVPYRLHWGQALAPWERDAERAREDLRAAYPDLDRWRRALEELGAHPVFRNPVRAALGVWG